MKLEFQGVVYHQFYDENGNERESALFVVMEGESAEMYHFGFKFDPKNTRIEDILRETASDIAATRRKRRRPKYKVKSVMPGKVWLKGKR